jgi:hypothetical protein
MQSESFLRGKRMRIRVISALLPTSDRIELIPTAVEALVEKVAVALRVRAVDLILYVRGVRVVRDRVDWMIEVRVVSAATSAGAPAIPSEAAQRSNA